MGRKLKNLINTAAFKAFLASGGAPGFTDSANGVVLARHLTQVDPKVFEKLYPDLAFMNAGVDMDNTGGYAAKIQSLRLLDEGGFKDAKDRSSNKGKISLTGEDSTILVTERDANSKWSDTDIKQAELANINLPSRYIQTHDKIYRRELDEYGLVGNDAKGIKGVLNYAGYTTDTAAGRIETLAAQDMYDEIEGIITAQRNAVNNTVGYMGNVFITQTRVINKLNATMLNTASGVGTVLNALKINFPDVMFLGTSRGDSATNTGRSTIFANSNEALKMRIPLPLTIGTIEKEGSFNFTVDSKYRIAGVDFLEDTAGQTLIGL